MRNNFFRMDGLDRTFLYTIKLLWEILDRSQINEKHLIFMKLLIFSEPGMFKNIFMFLRLKCFIVSFKSNSKNNLDNNSFK